MEGSCTARRSPRPGIPENPFSDADLADKLRENAEAFAGAERTGELTARLFAVEQMNSVRELTALLALDESGLTLRSAAT